MRFIRVNMDDPKHPFTSKKLPTMVNLEYVRAFYPRRGKIGTRLTFVDGNGFGVMEEFEKICKQVRRSAARRRRKVAQRQKNGTRRQKA